MQVKTSKMNCDHLAGNDKISQAAGRVERRQAGTSTTFLCYMIGFSLVKIQNHIIDTNYFADLNSTLAIMLLTSAIVPQTYNHFF